MIRASATGPHGRKIIFLGISEENVKRLKEGKPIHVTADDLGFKGDIVVCYAATELALEALFAPMIDPEHTTVHDESQRKRH